MQIANINDIRNQGMKALTENLGYYGTLKFLEQFESGYGDYTLEREKLFEGLTVNDLAEEIKGLKNKKK